MENDELINLVEDTTGAAAPNIATTDENLSINQMFQQTSMPSLAKQIFAELPMHGPTAALFNLKRKDGTKNFELVRNDVEVYPSDSIPTGLTQEVIQDLQSQYGLEADVIIGKLLRGLANDQENISTLSFLDATALDAGTLTLSTPSNAETTLFELTQKVHELVLKINSKNIRSYNAFVVLPYAAMGSIMGLNNYVGADDDDARGLLIAKVGQTKFYLSPDATSTTAYVGIKDNFNPSKSSAVFSPYASTIIEATNPDSGEETYHIFNRYAITVSPLHEAGNEMLHKFTIA